MRALVTGASGFVGAALIPRLLRDGHDVRAFARTPARVEAEIPVVAGDAVTGAGLDEALAGVDVAYFLIHAMEPVAEGGDGFDARERRSADNFVAAAQRAGVRRIVYLGGPVPADKPPSLHLASRLAVEEALLAGAPESVALRASIIIGAKSRSFRFLVRLVERIPVMVIPGWHGHRTQPIDGRDVTEFLATAGTSSAVKGSLSLDIAGPEVLTYGAIIERIRDLMLINRPALRIRPTVTPVASRVAAAIAGEEHELIGPLMEGLNSDLLPRDDRAAGLLGVRLHSFDAAVERALREWEAVEELAAR